MHGLNSSMMTRNTVRGINKVNTVSVDRLGLYLFPFVGIQDYDVYLFVPYSLFRSN